MRPRIVAALLLVAGCAPAATERSQLTVTIVGVADRSDGLAARLAAEASLPTLVARDAAGNTVPGLASSWRFVDDGRSLILRLRPAIWSDGKPLTSTQVVAAWRRAALRREPAIAAAGIAGAAAVAARRQPVGKLGVMAPIARVVEVRLDAASSLLLGWLAEPGLAITRSPKGATLGAYVATGPAAAQVLTRRAPAMGGEPATRAGVIRLSTTPDAAAAVAGFVRGTTDIVIGEGLAGLGEARTGAPREALRIDPLWGHYGYRVNARRSVLADPRLRSALAMAVDRRRLTASFGISGIAPAETIVPAALGGVATRAWQQMALPDRITAARGLLAAAGHDAANPLRLVLLLPPGRDHQRIAQAVAADWAAIGVLLAITIVAGEDHDRLVARGDFDLALDEASVPVPDPAALLAGFRCGPAYCNAAVDALLDRTRSAAPGPRAALLGEAEAMLLADPPLVPLFTPVRWALVGRNVDGWVPNRHASHPLARLAVRQDR